MLSVKQAAEVLGCHENTIRNLEKKGVLKARRNYLMYRLFEEKDILSLKVERMVLKGAENMEAIS